MNRQHLIEAAIIGLVLGMVGWLIADMSITLHKQHMLAELSQELSNQSFISFAHTMNDLKDVWKK